MRIVLDTNVLIAAFVSRGHCHELLEHVARSHELLSSEYILTEFREKLTGKLRVPQPLVEAALELQRSRMEFVELSALPSAVSRDPKDDPVLATAVAASADCLITGDKDLLELGQYEGIPILAPSSFWEFEADFEPRA